MKYGNRVRRPRRSARAFLRQGAFRRVHVALGIVFALGLATPSLGQERNRPTSEIGPGSDRPPTPGQTVDLPSKALNASLPSQLYAAALLAGLGEPESVRIEMQAVIAVADERFLRDVYANAVLAGFEWPGAVRHRIRVIGVQREHVTRYNDDVVNRVYAVSVLVGNEDTEWIRNALDRMVERSGVIIAPFWDGPQDEDANEGCPPNQMRDEYGECRDMNDIIDELMRRELERAAWLVDILIDLAEDVDWDGLTQSACSVLGEISVLGTAESVADLIAEIRNSASLKRRFWRLVGRWARNQVVNISSGATVGGVITGLDGLCRLRQYL